MEMARSQSSSNEPQADSPRQAKQATDAASKQVQERMDQETEQGFRGVEVDPTPNENYTLAGQNAGAPTPETDDKLARQARDARDEVARRAAGVAER